MKKAIGILCHEIESIPERTLSYLQAAYLYGAEAYIYRIQEVDTYWKHGYINALKWESGRLKNCQIDIPLYTEIYASIAGLKKYFPEYTQWLEKNTVFTDGTGITKLELQILLLQSELSAYAIPTCVMRSFPELQALMRAVPTAILKPTGGSKARGLMRLEQKDGIITYATKDGSGVFTEKEFQEYHAEFCENRHSFILWEPYINIKSDEGKAIDFRCLVSLNGEAEWENVRTYARIGGSEVASNISVGGSFNFAEDVLEQLVPEQSKEKLAEINQVALAVAALVQAHAKQAVSWLGIDICLDRDTNHVYVIEANSKPGVNAIGPWPLALVRAQYYCYLLQQEPDE